MKKRFSPLVIAVSALFAPLFFTPGCANTTQAPSGGDKDTIPPYIVYIDPLPGAVNVPVHDSKFVFEFNEYVTVKTASNIFLSPPQQKPPKNKIKGRSVVVWFEEDLDSNTTYTLNFTDAIADNNESNMFPGYTYVFSTGPAIDSLMVTGTVQDCNTLAPVKGATVLLYKDHADSAVFLKRPYAAAKTDDWGYFCLPFIADTTYRIYAIKDNNNNNIYDPDTETVGFVDSLIRPVLVANDTLPEMLKYDMKDTLECRARKSEYELNLFREKPSKQYLVNKERVHDRTAYITFMAPNAYIDSLWVGGYRHNQVITQFSILQDSLEIWVNDRRPAPDTLHLYVNYRKTDSLGVLKPALEHLKLTMPEGKRTLAKMSRKNIKKDDTTCVVTVNAAPETVEQNGIQFEFKYPIIHEMFDSIVFKSISPRQKEAIEEFTVVQDTTNLRVFVLRPVNPFQMGYDYNIKIPHRAFRDINGFYSDSTEVKITLPKDESLSGITANLSGVDRKLIVDLLGEKRDKVLRSYIIESDCTLAFPYLKKGKYCIRITDDGNRNSIVDTGSLLEHRQPEKVRFFELDDEIFIDLEESTEIVQDIDVRKVFEE